MQQDHLKTPYTQFQTLNSQKINMDRDLESTMTPITEIYETTAEIIKLQYKWSIPNLCLLKTDFLFLNSHNFSANNCAEPEWSLSLEESRGYLSIYLNIIKSATTQVRGYCKLSIIHHGTTIIEQCLPCGNFEPSGASLLGFVKERDLMSFMKDNSLQILCEINYMVNKVDIPTQADTPQQENILCADYGKLFMSERWSDVTISVKGVEFRAHKSILAARSQVFAAMFEHDMIEKRTNNVIINDTKPEVFKDLLYFIYSGCVPNIQATAPDLLAAADFYALEKLKLVCARWLSNNFSTATSVGIYILASQLNIDFLKAQAIDFIISHSADVIKTPAWSSMKKHHPKLINELFEAKVQQLNMQ